MDVSAVGKNRLSYKSIINLAVPIIFSSFSAALMSFVDASFVSKYDITQFAAILTASTFATTASAVFAGIIAYMVSFVSQYYGAKEPEKCSKIVWQSLYLSILFIIILAIFSPFIINIFRALGHKEEVIAYEKQYFFFILSTHCVYMLAVSINNLYKGIGKVKIIMFVGIFSNLLNIFLDWALIYGKLHFPELGGIMGSGSATLISSIIALLIYVAILVLDKTYRRQYMIFSNMRPDIEFIKHLLRYAFPAGVEGIAGTGFYSFCLLIISMAGEISIVSANIAFTIEGISIVPISGIVSAIGIMVATEKGGGFIENVSVVLKKGIKIILCFNIVIIILFFGFPSVLISFFQNEKDSVLFSQIVELTLPLIRITAIWIITDSIRLAIGGALRALGDTKFMMIIFFLVPPIFYILIPFIMVQLGLGLIWIWLSLFVFTIVMLIIVSIRFLRGAWKKIDILQQDKGEVLSEA